MQLGYCLKNIVRKGNHCMLPSWTLRKLLTVFHTSQSGMHHKNTKYKNS